MSTSIASSCVLLNQQREQMIQYLKRGGSVSIASCQAAPKKRTVRNCTVVKNGRVIVKLIDPKSAQEP